MNDFNLDLSLFCFDHSGFQHSDVFDVSYLNNITAVIRITIHIRQAHLA